MPGPPPKPSHMRQRRNKVTTRATLEAPAKVKVPKLPARARGRGAGAPRVRAWWSDVWKSPMASEYLDVHRHGLEAIAELFCGVLGNTVCWSDSSLVSSSPEGRRVSPARPGREVEPVGRNGSSLSPALSAPGARAGEPRAA